MEEDDASDQSTKDSQQPDEQPLSGEQSQATDQSDQTTDESEQSDEQPSFEQAAAEQSSADDQSGDQAQDQATDTEQTAEGAGDSDQSSTSTDADDTVALGGGGGDTAKTSTRKIKVIAEFTQEGGGQNFMGEDIQILVAEWNNGQQGALLFPLDPAAWQMVINKGPKITTPSVSTASKELVIYPQARIRLPGSMVTYQNLSDHFVFTIPTTDTLSVKFDARVQKIDKTVTAPDADKAKGIAAPSPKQYAAFELKAEPLGNQQFHVTGKYYTGTISSPDGRPL